METVYTKEVVLRAVNVDLNGTWMPSDIFETMQEAAEDDAARYGFGRIPLAQNWGLAWVLTRVHLQMDRYPRLGSRVHVSTWALQAKTHFVPRQFLLEDEDGTLGRASSQWMLLDLDKRCIARTSVLGGYAADFDVPPVLADPRKFRAPGILEAVEVRPVRYSDVDLNGHMNNTKYLNWICDLYPVAFLQSMEMRSCQVAYVTEATIGQEVELHMLETDGAAYVSGCTPQATVFDAQIEWATRKGV